VACSIPSGAAAGPRAGDHRAAQGAVARSPRFVMRKLRVRGSLVTASGQPGRKAVDGRACVMKARIGLLLTCPACVGGGRLWRQRRLGSASAPTPTPTPATTGPPSSGDPWVISSVSPVPSTAPSSPASRPCAVLSLAGLAPCRFTLGASRQPTGDTGGHTETRRPPRYRGHRAARSMRPRRYGGAVGSRRRFASALWPSAASRSSLAARRCSAARRRCSSPWVPSASCSCSEAARSWTSAEDSAAVAASSAAATAACRAQSMFLRAARTCSTPEPRSSLIWASISPRRCASSAMRSPSFLAR
jgi:hypothetical protein